jgi:putative tryptophan/tyrosine transport system substrate-binding protein
MRRREFITLLGGAVATWPLAARAQQPGRTYRIAMLIPVARQSPPMDAFIDEMRQAEFVEGRNLEIIPGGFNVPNEQIAEVTEKMVKAAPDAIVSGGIVGTKAAQRATQTIPIVAMSEDMLIEGLVDSLSRPGGNTIGLSILSPGLDGKRQDLLIEIVPHARRIAALFETRITPAQHTQTLQKAAQARGIELAVYGAAVVDDIAPAIDAAKAAGAEAVNFLATPLYSNNKSIVFPRIQTLRLPAIYQWPDLAEDGGLAGYGPRFTEMFRQRARILIKVLRGIKPADLPVEQPTRFELVINLKTAKTIGYEIPATLVLRADKVIE